MLKKIKIQIVFKGMNIVVSGKFNSLSRDEIKKLIQENGGKVVSSVSSKTDLLVAGENMGPSKLEKANKLAVKMCTEEEFLSKVPNNKKNDSSKTLTQGKLPF